MFLAPHLSGTDTAAPLSSHPPGRKDASETWGLAGHSQCPEASPGQEQHWQSLEVSACWLLAEVWLQAPACA